MPQAISGEPIGWALRDAVLSSEISDDFDLERAVDASVQDQASSFGLKGAGYEYCLLIGKVIARLGANRQQRAARLDRRGAP